MQHYEALIVSEHEPAANITRRAQTSASVHGEAARVHASHIERFSSRRPPAPAPLEATAYETEYPRPCPVDLMLLAGQHAFGEAVQALHGSAAQARSQHAVIELAQTLTVLAAVARQQGDEATVRQAYAERSAIVDRIGAEARVMAWAQGLPRIPRQPAAGHGPLSRREREVAALIVGGLTNRQIAESLVISERTVENHVSSILARLGVDTRAQVAAWGA